MSDPAINYKPQAVAPALNHYLKTIEKELSSGNATEHTHRPALKSLIESLGSGLTATNEPKRIKCGAPDFIVTHGQTPLGYIETKDVGLPLDKAEKTDQIKRYRESLGNLILTDYLEFRWYVGGENRMTTRLAKVGRNGRLVIEKGVQEEVVQPLEAFISHEGVTVVNSKELAVRMARTARLIYDTIRRSLEEERENGPLHLQMKGFREVLIHDLTKDQFADMYAQTICYGLFTARCNAKDTILFTRRHAAYDLPKTNPFLRKLFAEVAGPELDGMPHAWAVDDLAALLNRADIKAILHDFGHRTRREDPVIHFYETFLAAYNPALREVRGVYFTPEPIVSYIVRSVDKLLKKDFGIPDGLADSSKVQVKSPDGKSKAEAYKLLILDPATGTGTFLHNIINHIYKSFRHDKGMWSSYVSKHLLPRIFGFELLMAPYAVAHMKLDLLLNQTGYEFSADDRLGVYLTNTLEEVHQLTNVPAFTRWLNEEADSASKVKQELPVMVVVGNPPYSGHSANTGQWINNLLRGVDTQTGKLTGNYFEVDGGPLGERNPKWLNDDYVKFIRFAQWRIEQTGYGVLAFISNHGYLDNPTFRGMRQSLLDTFDEIYVLDLHGNSKKKERSPDGSQDENVFDIQQGVAIGIYVKNPKSKGGRATVRHAHLWGRREIKYQALLTSDQSTTGWNTLAPQSPFYLFVPQDVDRLPEYNEFWSVTKIFEIYASTVTTARNDFPMAFDPDTLAARINDLRDKSFDDEDLRAKYALKDVSYWKLSTARKELSRIKDVEGFVRPYCYRPFDFRFVYYHDAVCERLRAEVMQHMAEDNLALLTHRPQSPGDFTFAYCTRMIGDQCVAANKTAGGGNSFQFPLYLYPAAVKKTLFDTGEPTDSVGGRRPNLATEFIAEFGARLKLAFIPDGGGDLTETFGPKDVFNYIYAVLHSPTYRSRYAEFLRMDFPKVPLTSGKALFRELCALGAELVELHLMDKTAPAVTRYPIPGDNTVEKVLYTEPIEGKGKALFPQANGEEVGGRVWINTAQYFEGVPREVWHFQVGGYQVCQKWLKDRKGRKLTYDDLKHYQYIVSALATTSSLMVRIDEVIEARNGWPIV
jgi:predicted helicase